MSEEIINLKDYFIHYYDDWGRLYCVEFKGSPLELENSIKRLQAENKRLQMLSCANCGEKYLSPDGAELYEKNVQLQAENEELKHKNEILLGQLVINDGEDVTVQISQSQFNEYNELQAENERLNSICLKLQSNYKLLKSLEEIREYLQQSKKKKSNFYTLNDVITDIAGNIEKIISEVLK